MIENLKRLIREDLPIVVVFCIAYVACLIFIAVALFSNNFLECTFGGGAITYLTITGREILSGE